MWSLLVQAPSNAFNPEAIINAAVAAKSAELAATQTFWIGLIAVFMLLCVGAAIMGILYKMSKLERNTNGMRINLVEATRKLALLEGNKKGREELVEEGKGADESDTIINVAVENMDVKELTLPKKEK